MYICTCPVYLSVQLLHPFQQSPSICHLGINSSRALCVCRNFKNASGNIVLYTSSPWFICWYIAGILYITVFDMIILLDICNTVIKNISTSTIQQHCVIMNRRVTVYTTLAWFSDHLWMCIWRSSCMSCMYTCTCNSIVNLDWDTWHMYDCMYLYMFACICYYCARTIFL